MKEKQSIDPSLYKLTTNLNGRKVLFVKGDPTRVIPEHYSLTSDTTNDLKGESYLTFNNVDPERGILIGAPTAYQETAAKLQRGMKQIDMGRRVADEYIEEMYPHQLPKKKKHLRKQVARFVTAMMESEEEGSAMRPYGNILDNPDIGPLIEKVRQLNQLITSETVDQAQLLSKSDRMKLVGDLVTDITKLRYSPDQVMHLLKTAGITSEEGKRLIRSLMVSAPVMAVGNFALGSLSEGVATYIGIFGARNQILQFMNSLDPETRNMVGVTFPLCSMALVYYLTFLKNKLSNKFYNEGSDLVLDPNMVIDEALTNRIMDPKEYNIVRSWIAHFSYPGNWLDEKWWAMWPAAKDNGATFFIGNMAANVIKGSLIVGGESLLWYKKRYEAKHNKKLNLNLKVVDNFLQWVGNRKVSKKLMKKFFNDFAPETPDIEVLEDFIKDVLISHSQATDESEQKSPLTISHPAKKGNIFTKPQLAASPGD